MSGRAHNLESRFYGPIINSCNDYLSQRDYDLLVLSSNPTTRENAGVWYRDKLQERRVDGYILISHVSQLAALATLNEVQIPRMCLGIKMPGFRSAYIESNNYRGAHQGVQYLHTLGHRRIALIGDTNSSMSGRHRMQGALQAVREYGLTIPDGAITYGDFSRHAGSDAMKSMAEIIRSERVTVVFAFNDYMAFGAIDAAHELGMSVPGDISVMGFDDVELAADFHPALTTIRQNTAVMGEIIGESLIKLIEDSQFEPPEVMVDTTLVIRSSVSPA